MKEHPILFNAPMVRAILDGKKTMTRRIMKPQPICVKKDVYEWKDGLFSPGKYPNNTTILNHCPYGQPGDHLWVRETHARTQSPLNQVHYMADGAIPDINERHDAGLLRIYPSIHMPRWASRIILEITKIRVEQLQDITEADAQAEGFKSVGDFADIWNELNDKRGYGWDKNPWVWVVEFERVKQ